MPVKIHGKEYYTVNERLGILNKEFGRVRYSLSTEVKPIQNIVQEYTQTNGSKGYKYQTEVIVSATLTLYFASNNGSGEVHKREYTGHAHEIKDSSQLNSTSYIENAETSAIGRALASAGWGGTEFCSANELESALETQHYAPSKEEQAKFDKLVQSHYYDNNRDDMFVWWKGGKSQTQIHAYLTTMTKQVADYDDRQQAKALKAQAKAQSKTKITAKPKAVKRLKEEVA